MAEKIKKTRNVLPIKRKYNALKEILSGISKKSVAKKYGVPKSTVSTWLANKDKIFAAYESGEINPKRQKMKKRAENENLDKAVYSWFHNTRANNVPVSGVVLREKALQFAKSLHLDDLRASDGWLDRWKSRHNVTFREVPGEEKSCTPERTASWNETHLPTILSRYELKDIFIADEFCLFYQALPSKSVHFKAEGCSVGKISKVCLTGSATANATGEKLLMFVIGKSVKPRCFKSIKNLPCRYRSQNKSRMDGNLFTEWVRQLDNKFVAEGIKIALIIDNCRAHPRTDNLKAVELIFLPPNITSKTQPMDHGVIRSLKAHYRAKVVKRYIASIDAKKGISSVNILNAISSCRRMGSGYSSYHYELTNYFCKAGISTESQQQSLDDADDPFQALDSEIEELRARDKALIPSEITADEYIDQDIDTDDSLFTFETCAMTDDEILSKVTSIDKDEENCEDTDEIEDIFQPPTRYEVMQALEVLQTCTFYDADVGDEMRAKVNAF